MKIEIEIGMDVARITAALAEVKREGGQRKALYPQWIAKGKLSADEGRRRLLALADACRIVQAALVEVEELPFVVGLAAALTPKPLPYDPGAAVRDEPPHCRFCGQAGEQAKAKGGDAWRCSMEGCVGHREWVRREVFENHGRGQS